MEDGAYFLPRPAVTARLPVVFLPFSRLAVGREEVSDGSVMEYLRNITVSRCRDEYVIRLVNGCYVELTLFRVTSAGVSEGA